MHLPCLLPHLSLLILLSLDVLAQQCNTPGFVPCPPNDSASGSNSAGGSDISGSGSVPSLSGSGGIGDGDISPAGSAPVDGAALDGIQGGDSSGDVSPPKRLVKKTPEGLEGRQSTTFCCRPAPVQCLVLNNGLPACYVCSSSFRTSARARLTEQEFDTDSMAMTGPLRHSLFLPR